MMLKPSREQLRLIFKKSKKLRIPIELEEEDFSPLTYYSWYDLTDNALFMVFEKDGKLDGIKWNVTKLAKTPLKKAMCSICEKHQDLGDVALITAKTRKLPKGVDFRTRGNYACLDYKKCNKFAKESAFKTLLGRIYAEE